MPSSGIAIKVAYFSFILINFGRITLLRGQDLDGTYVAGDQCSHAAGHCCECTSSYGRCMLGDELPLSSGCGPGPSCSKACKGDLAWKSTYRQARANETAIVTSWWRGNRAPKPTKKWPMPSSNGRFAVMLSGELRRNFVATFFSWTTNIVQASGGAVDLYFDVWSHRLNPLSAASRDLARSHPNTKAFVEETFEEHDRGLQEDNPWLFEALKETNGQEVFLKGHFGQMRKMWRVYNLVRASGIQYTLVVRGRPDAAILEPLDLRLMHKEYSRYASVQDANGHYIAIPERDPYSVITDVFAVGTMEAIAAFASPPLAFNQAPHEIFISQNLARHGFARTNRTILEEIKDPLKNYQSVCCRMRPPDLPVGTPIDLVDTPWEVLPAYTRAGNFSPLMSSTSAYHPFGDGTCSHEGAACIPILRLRFTFALYIELKPWFYSGTTCINSKVLFSKHIHNFIVAAGIGTSIRSSSVVATSHGGNEKDSYYCLRIPGLAQAHALSLAFACVHMNADEHLDCKSPRISRAQSCSNPYPITFNDVIFFDSWN